MKFFGQRRLTPTVAALLVLAVASSSTRTAVVGAFCAAPLPSSAVAFGRRTGVVKTPSSSPPAQSSAGPVPSTQRCRRRKQYPPAFTKALRARDDDDEDEDEDDDEDEPLSKGVNSVSWLPSCVGAKGPVDAAVEASGGKGAEVLPLFPLGGIVYTPNSEHILNIFEPRYREMYTDILMNGSKKFVVSMSHPTDKGRFAQTGVLFELEDLKEVSEQTGDRIKYICSHKVTGRVKIHRILNPEAWENRDTYLRVEGTITDDSGKNAPPENDAYGAVMAAAEEDLAEQKALRDAFCDLVDLQHNLEEDVRFTRASAASLAVKPGSGEDGLWQTIRLWQSFVEQRLMARQNELQREFQEKLQAFLKKDKGLKAEELPR